MKTIKRLTALLLAAMLLFGCACADESKVIYRGQAEKFLILPDDVSTDLFQNFKNCMPGDTLEQQIIVQNTSSDSILRIFFYAEPTSEEDEEFLSQINIRVAINSFDFYDGPANEQGVLSEPTLLGTFTKPGQVPLTVTIEIPVTMGNEFQGWDADVPWVFVADLIPQGDDDPEDPEHPKTGDWFRAEVWGSAFAVIAAAGALLIVYLRKKRDTDEEAK